MLGTFFFIKRGYVPYLVIFFLSSKHSKTLSKPSPNSTKIFNQIQTSQPLIPDSRLKSQASILHSNLHQEFSKVEVCGLIVETFLSTSPTIYPLYLLQVYGSLWSFMNSWIMELLLHILLWSIFAYYHEMELLCDVYGFHASMIKLWKLIYICMLLVGWFICISKLVGLSTLEVHDFIYMNNSPSCVW